MGSVPACTREPTACPPALTARDRHLLTGALAAVAITTVLVPTPWTFLVAAAGAGGTVIALRRSRERTAGAFAAWTVVAIVSSAPLSLVWPIGPAIALTSYVLLAAPTRLPSRSWCTMGHAERVASRTVVGMTLVPYWACRSEVQV